MKAILFFGQHKKKLHKGPFKDYSISLMNLINNYGFDLKLKMTVEPIVHLIG
jgi:hypothetical protein